MSENQSTEPDSVPFSFSIPHPVSNPVPCIYFQLPDLLISQHLPPPPQGLQLATGRSSWHEIPAGVNGTGRYGALPRYTGWMSLTWKACGDALLGAMP